MSSPTSSPSSLSSFVDVTLTFQGKSYVLREVSTGTSGLELYRQVSEVLGFDNHNTEDNSGGNSSSGGGGGGDSFSLKLLFQGKRIAPQADVLPLQNSHNKNSSLLDNNKKQPMKPLKIMVMATKQSTIQEIANKRSDPTIRGLDEELKRQQQQQQQQHPQHWGPDTMQDKAYKFCRFHACTWHSFGHRPTEKTPHAFEAMNLLEKLATDPGIVAIMKERELVVGTLGEMDPIDDRLMQKKQQEGACLLGYNTNHGLRIDIKLRTDDLQAFRPYPDLVSTLIHELSHNWVGDHNLLFWTNYAQMRAEYFYTHARLRSTIIVRGKTTAELAGLNDNKARLENVFEYVMDELVGKMAQHGLHPGMIEAPIRQRIQELKEQHSKEAGQRLGTASEGIPSVGTAHGDGASTRELALAAAERRAREEEQKRRNESSSSSPSPSRPER
jgi:hypothetical protein